MVHIPRLLIKENTHLIMRLDLLFMAESAALQLLSFPVNAPELFVRNSGVPATTDAPHGGHGKYDWLKACTLYCWTDHMLRVSFSVSSFANA